jgi:Stealth protein CR1, conserved region 1
MFEAHTDDVGYDIDVVFSWVDGTDPAFLSRRARWLPRTVPGDGDGRPGQAALVPAAR